MPNKLFIGNLSFNVADEGLSEFFASMNVPVENIRVMRDMETGRSRGFAFVELPADADMGAIINQLNGKVLDGRPLTVNEARQQKPREGGGGGFNRNHGKFGKRGGGGGGHQGGHDRRPRNDY